ncbi:MAG: tRNA (guanosine(37)-N1)-methyltransferase TrmD [Myxococcales bacterium]|nr:tRNA (guanosine(37)-N1)-methyltransferase TrmD [Myxococcales bacterium]MCB9708644.1 tRNA (guanosine(37)-N1)-methyltransferase TrmD [Myxococcales bacterium]
MRFGIVTIFPEFFVPFFTGGILGKAIASGLVAETCLSPRLFATDKHRSVDDEPYGGGGGMVMRPGPIISAVENLEALHGVSRRILLTPSGTPFTQNDAVRLSSERHIVLVCGRYEGIDERVSAQMCEELSIGDFVLMGGETAAMAVIECIARLVPGVLGNPISSVQESFNEGLLEHPHFTRPVSFRGQHVPEVLRSGDHQQIAAWRRAQSLARTRARRPDLLSKHRDPSIEEVVATRTKKPL